MSASAVLTMDPPARVYLVAPPELSPAALSAALSARIAAAGETGEEIGCVLLRRPVGASKAEWAAALAAILPAARAAEVAVMLEDRAEWARSLDADGVHFSSLDLAALASARKQLGDLNVGVYCAGSRHDAMEAAEAGADYVAFDPESPEIAWWAQMMTPPCVAWLDAAGAATALDQGAEFVAKPL